MMTRIVHIEPLRPASSASLWLYAVGLCSSSNHRAIEGCEAANGFLVSSRRTARRTAQLTAGSQSTIGKYAAAKSAHCANEDCVLLPASQKATMVTTPP
jgi:hypothetical protein